MRTLVAIALTTVAIPAWARPTIVGDGQPTTQTRQVSSFDAIDLETSADVAVKVGGTPKVTVTADGNLQPYLKTDVRSGVLVIGSDQNLEAKKALRVEVSVPELKKLAIRGSGNVTVDGGRGDVELSLQGAGDLRWSGDASRLRLSLVGSGDVALAGSATDLVVELDGSGDVNARTMKARNASVAVSGSGDVQLRLDGGTLRASVNGSGDVAWSGNATVEKAAASGSGHIHHSDRPE